MKSLKSLFIVLISMVAFVLVFSCRSVYATGGLVLNPGATTNSVTNATTNTSRLNTSTTNNINSDVNKDLPQTGETDTYIIAGIGAVALVIGTIAFIKSRSI